MQYAVEFPKVGSDMTESEIIEKIEHAEHELTALYWALREQRGKTAIAKRLDTILGKLYNLKYAVKESQ